MNNLAKPLFFGAFVALFSSFFFASKVERNIPDSELKQAFRTRNLSVQESAGISTIQLRGPSSFLEVKTTYEIGKTDHISFTHQFKADDLKSTADLDAFDIQQAKLERNGDTLTLTIAPTRELPHFVDTVLTIKLPNRDWTIDQAVEFSSLDDAPEIKQVGEPINLTVIAESPNIRGHFKELVIWQVASLSYKNLFFSNDLEAKRISVFAKHLNIHRDQGQSLISQLILHGGREGNINIQDLQLLNNTRWQELTAEEKAQLAAYKALNDNETEADESTTEKP